MCGALFVGIQYNRDQNIIKAEYDNAVTCDYIGRQTSTAEVFHILVLSFVYSLFSFMTHFS
jgi:hypothetical protein